MQGRFRGKRVKVKSLEIHVDSKITLKETGVCGQLWKS